jgi:hypothetical protein
MKRTTRIALVALAAWLPAPIACAQQAYKHVDEKGRVTYSQVPPDKDAKKIALPPPRRTTPPADVDYEREALRRQATEDRRRDHERQMRERQEAVEEAKRRRVDELRADCVRNRGTDCNDSETIRRMEAERGPSQYRPTAGRSK